MTNYKGDNLSAAPIGQDFHYNMVVMKCWSKKKTK